MDKDAQVKSGSYPQVSFDEFAPTTYEEWRKEIDVFLKGAPFEKKLLTKTYEGITLQPIYTLENVENLEEPLSYPGGPDYLRGTDAAGYAENLWEIAQAVNVPCPKAANELIREELAKGSTAVNLKLGHQGVHISGAADVKTLLSGVDLEKTTLQIDCGITALPQILSWIDEATGKLSAAHGLVGTDPVGRLAFCGRLPKKLETVYDEMAKVVTYAREHAPKLRTVLVDGNVYANGGAHAVQELSACMSTAAAYIEALCERGVSVDDAAKSIRFSFSLGANFFMEIAKLRAAREVWAQIVRAFGGSEEAQKIDIFARTSSFTKTIYDPYVNLLRATTETFAGVVGGVNAMEVAPLDEAYGSSDEQTRRIARNIQIMMQNEFDLTRTIDPAGGSWYVESLTAEVAKAVWAAFQKIEAEGGILASLRAGALQGEIAKVLSDRFQKLATRADRAVGTNMYANMLEKPLSRGEREIPACHEDCEAAEQVEAIRPHRWTEQFEALRAKTEAFEEKTGEQVKVFLANMGPVSQHKARADFSAGFLEVGHFHVLTNNGFGTVEEAAKAAEESGADVAVICSTDETYPELVPPLAKLIKASCPKMMVLLAGAPAPEFKESYLEAGVDDFIHVKANCYQILSNIQKARGIC